MLGVESVQREIRGSFLGTLKERGRSKKALKNSMTLPLPSYQFPSGRIALPLGKTFPGKVDECTCAANTSKSIEMLRYC